MTSEQRRTNEGQCKYLGHNFLLSFVWYKKFYSSWKCFFFTVKEEDRNKETGTPIIGILRAKCT